MSNWKRKNLLNIYDLTKNEINCVLDKSYFYRELFENSSNFLDVGAVLRGKTVVNLFFEPSTRTRMSFEKAEKALGACILQISVSESSYSKRETIRETLQNIKALGVDLIVIRHFFSSFFSNADLFSTEGLLNAGSGTHSHPTQALADLFTLFIHKGSIKDLKIALVGDILYSRVARSYLWAFKKIGAEVMLIAPQNMIPSDAESMGVKISHSMKEGLCDRDVIFMLRVQEERQENILSIRDYSDMYRLKESMISCLKKDVLIFHPGPVCVGIEMDKNLIYSDRSVIFDQVKNGVYVRMALLALIADSL